MVLALQNLCRARNMWTWILRASLLSVHNAQLWVWPPSQSFLLFPHTELLHIKAFQLQGFASTRAIMCSKCVKLKAVARNNTAKGPNNVHQWQPLGFGNSDTDSSYQFPRWQGKPWDVVSTSDIYYNNQNHKALVICRELWKHNSWMINSVCISLKVFIQNYYFVERNLKQSTIEARGESFPMEGNKSLSSLVITCLKLIMTTRT